MSAQSASAPGDAQEDRAAAAAAAPPAARAQAGGPLSLPLRRHSVLYTSPLGPGAWSATAIVKVREACAFSCVLRDDVCARILHQRLGRPLA